MDLDFSPYFDQYRQLAAAADQIFERINQEHAGCVTCKIECCDCCFALFDLTLIEAIYINFMFLEKFQGTEREQLMEKANKADRQIYKIKKKAYQEMSSGKAETEILHKVAEERIRCPLLNENNTCDMYEDRPITCRLYGVPTAIGGEGYTCGLSGFQPGIQYPTVNMDGLHQKLYEIGSKLVREICSRHKKVEDILVPLSMALLTDYNEAYLGIDNPQQEGEQ